MPGSATTRSKPPDVLDEGADAKTDYRERIVWAIAVIAATPLVIYAFAGHRWAQFAAIQYAYSVLALSFVFCKDRYSLRRARVRLGFFEYLPMHLGMMAVLFCCQLEWFQWRPIMPGPLTRGPLCVWICGLTVIAFVYAGVGMLEKRLDRMLAR